MAVWSISKDLTVESLKWAFEVIFQYFPYDVDIHLFKKIYVDDSIIIGVSATPMAASSSRFKEMLKMQQDSGYEHVISSPALQKLCDGTMISVNVEGQYINKGKPSDADLFRSSFNSVPALDSDFVCLFVILF